MGRFLNADSQLNTQSGVIGINLFSYCENHPTTRGDSNGNLWKNIVWKTIISVVKAVCMVKEIKRIKKEIRSMPRPTKNITSSFRSTLKRNANTIKSEKKNNGIVKSGLNFYNWVRNGGEWDLKQQSQYQGTFTFNDRTVQGQDLGNINFGYTGKALGLPNSVLLLGAGVAQIKAGTSTIPGVLVSNGDDLRDQLNIMYGIMLYEEDNKCKTLELPFHLGVS